MPNYVIERTDLPLHPLLGRHVHHDSRSKQYAFRAGRGADIVSVLHESHIPVLDQGDLGSCTGNATVYALSKGAYWDSLQGVVTDWSEDQAVRLYSIATGLDGYPGQYPPEDTGSDGLSIAKAAQQAGYISGYQHALSLNDALVALSARPVITGITWYNSMFEAASDGTVRVDFSSGVAGGHEICLDEIDLRRHRIGFSQSWGSGWGKAGRGYLDIDAYEHLLADDGDVTIFVPITAPAPVPDPVVPAPAPAPGPLDADLIALKNGTAKWRASGLYAGTSQARKAVTTYLAQQGVL